MPCFWYHCQPCGKRQAFMGKSQTEESTTPRECKVCAGPVVREISVVTSRTVETIDNGLMSKPVERLANAQEIYKERAHRK